MDVELSNYIADIDDIVGKEEGDSAARVVVWPPAGGSSRGVTPEILTPPPSYAQLEKENYHALARKENSHQMSRQTVSQTSKTTTFQSYQQQTHVHQSAGKSSIEQYNGNNRGEEAAGGLDEAASWNLEQTNKMTGTEQTIKSPLNKRQKTSKRDGKNDTFSSSKRST